MKYLLFIILSVFSMSIFADDPTDVETFEEFWQNEFVYGQNDDFAPSVPALYETKDAAKIKLVKITDSNRKIVAWKNSPVRRSSATYRNVIEPRGGNAGKCTREKELALLSIGKQKELLQNAASVVFSHANGNGREIDFLIDGVYMSQRLVDLGYALEDNGSNTQKTFCEVSN